MRNFDQFGIPVFGLKPGLRRFEFEVDDDFFKSFESNPIQSGNYKIIIDFDKRDNEFLLQFGIRGTFESPCDRCLADIRVPSEINKLIWVKYTDKENEVDFEDDIIFIEKETHWFNVAELINELIILSIPIVKRYDCENDLNPKCDFKVLSYLEESENADAPVNDLLAQALNKIKGR
ncbi:MAG TPA: hypothetical protein DCX89_06920 [Saprospirales bacterium]|nr:hypothetical protein [Saprospirales bacterium]HAY71606.1 hypothetical protein [Saprospirales bacterium]HRQ30144.1 DUF177 domain-containing protein [Saprospiraceae bacterium]